MRLFQPDMAGDLDQPAATCGEKRFRPGNKIMADAKMATALSHHQRRNSSYRRRPVQHRHDMGRDDADHTRIQHRHQANGTNHGQARRHLLR